MRPLAIRDVALTQRVKADTLAIWEHFDHVCRMQNNSKDSSNKYIIHSPTAVGFTEAVFFSVGWLIEKWIRYRKTSAEVAGPHTTVPLDDTAPQSCGAGASGAGKRKKNKIKGGCNIHLCYFDFHQHP